LDFEKLCKNILELDSKIRFAGVVNTKGVLINNLEQKGVEQYLSPDELKMSIHYSMWEWEKSQNLSHELGFERSSVLAPVAFSNHHKSLYFTLRIEIMPFFARAS